MNKYSWKETKGRKDINTHILCPIPILVRAGFPVFHPHVSLRGFDSPFGVELKGGKNGRQGIRDAETKMRASSAPIPWKSFCFVFLFSMVFLWCLLWCLFLSKTSMLYFCFTSIEKEKFLPSPLERFEGKKTIPVQSKYYRDSWPLFFVVFLTFPQVRPTVFFLFSRWVESEC